MLLSLSSPFENLINPALAVESSSKVWEEEKIAMIFYLEFQFFPPFHFCRLLCIRRRRSKSLSPFYPAPRVKLAKPQSHKPN